MSNCYACGSNKVVIRRIIHHFRCCEQASEHMFGIKLICPKCKKGLIQEDFDYDYSGTLTLCASCGLCLG